MSVCACPFARASFPHHAPRAEYPKGSRALKEYPRVFDEYSFERARGKILQCASVALYACPQNSRYEGNVQQYERVTQAERNVRDFAKTFVGGHRDYADPMAAAAFDALKGPAAAVRKKLKVGT